MENPVRPCTGARDYGANFLLDVIPFRHFRCGANPRVALDGAWGGNGARIRKRLWNNVQGRLRARRVQGEPINGRAERLVVGKRVRLEPKAARPARSLPSGYCGPAGGDSAYRGITKVDTIRERQTGEGAEDAWYVELLAGEREVARVFARREQAQAARCQLAAWIEAGSRGETRVFWSSWKFGLGAMTFGLVWLIALTVISRSGRSPDRPGGNSQPASTAGFSGVALAD